MCRKKDHTVKNSHICLNGALKGGPKEWGREIFDKIEAENFPKLMKDINSQIRKAFKPEQNKQK